MKRIETKHLWIALVMMAGCGRPDPADRPLRPSEVLSFDTLYGQNCAGCHGQDGKFGPAPPLNDPLFLAIFSEKKIEEIVTKGRPGTLMPRFARDQGGTLTPEQIQVIARGLGSKWDLASEIADLGKTLPPYDQPSTVEPGDGKAVFAAYCAGCHGPEGRGTKGAGSLRDPAFLDLVSDHFLRRIVITGRPDLGMPDYRRLDEPTEPPMTDAQIAQVVSLLKSWKAPSKPAGNLR